MICTNQITKHHNSHAIKAFVAQIIVLVHKLTEQYFQLFVCCSMCVRQTIVVHKIFDFNAFIINFGFSYYHDISIMIIQL